MVEEVQDKLEPGRINRAKIWGSIWGWRGMFLLSVAFAVILAVMPDISAGERSMEPTEPAPFNYAAQEEAAKDGRRGFYRTKSGNLYLYDSGGNKMAGCFFTVEDTERSYTYYFGSSGRAHTGFLVKNNKIYYFLDNYVMAQSELIMSDGKEYYFGEDGVLEP